ncbi:unnamed protein product [Wickerhamomyces anomalus]
MSNTNNNENITPAALLEQLVYVDTFMPEIDDPSQLDERLTAELSAFADESFIFPDEEKPSKPSDSDATKSTGSNGADNNNKTRSPNDEEILKRFNEMNQSFANNQIIHPQQPKFNTLQQTNSLQSGISNILSPLSTQHQSSNHNPITMNPIHTNNNNSNGNDVLLNLPKVPVPPGAQSSLIAAGLSQTQIDALAALVAQHQGVDNNDLKSQDVGSLNSLINPSQSLINPSSTGSNSVKSEIGGEVDVDKRRRNTAASARFRIKKKLKEQQLERNVRELNELTLTLEKKIQTLEMENKLLRNLVVEKGEQKNNDELEYLKKRAKLSVSNDNSNGQRGDEGGSASSF